VVGISSENLAKTKTLGTYPIRKRRAMQLAWLERVGKAKVESAPKNLLYMGPIESDPRPKSLGVKDNGWWSGEKV
jgi:hypothetical protein